jgi:hypothetical protein
LHVTLDLLIETGGFEVIEPRAKARQLPRSQAFDCFLDLFNAAHKGIISLSTSRENPKQKPRHRCRGFAFRGSLERLDQKSMPPLKPGLPGLSIFKSGAAISNALR